MLQGYISHKKPLATHTSTSSARRASATAWWRMVRSWRRLRGIKHEAIDTIPVWRQTATMLDVVFLIIWILVVLGLVLYLFYWNRVLGFLLSLLVRLLSWNQASASTWVDVGAHSTYTVRCSEGHRQLHITRVDTVFPSCRKNPLQGPTISHQQPDNSLGQRPNILEVLDQETYGGR